MESIRIGVLRSRHRRSTDGFQVFGDRGTGQIDWSHPITPRRVLLWDDASPVPGHAMGGHAMGRHLDDIVPEGHVMGTHLYDEHLRPAALISFETDKHTFGRFRHAVVMEDAVGNRASADAVIVETVINSAPISPDRLMPVSYEALSSRLTFSFDPSYRLIG